MVAPDDPVFREVLGGSALLIRPEQPDAAARALAGWIRDGALARAAGMSRANVARWNAAAAEDGRASSASWPAIPRPTMRWSQLSHTRAMADAAYVVPNKSGTFHAGLS